MVIWNVIEIVIKLIYSRCDQACPRRDDNSLILMI